MKFGTRGQLTDVISVKCLVNQFRGYPGYGVLIPQNCHIPLTCYVALTTVYTLPYDTDKHNCITQNGYNTWLKNIKTHIVEHEFYLL